MLKLEIWTDGRLLETRTLPPGAYLLGRLPENEIVLNDEAIWPQHLRLEVTEAGGQVEDLAFGQDVRLDGEVVSLTAFRPGQRLTIGAFELRFAQAQEAQAAAAAAPAAPPPPEEPAEPPTPAATPSEPPPAERTVIMAAPKQESAGDRTVVAAGRGPRARLRVCQGDISPREIELPAGRHLLGRAEECRLRTGDKTVSRRHAEIEVSAQGVRVRDLGSSGGTLAAGRRITEAALEVGETVQAGGIVLELTEAPGEAPVPKAAPTKVKAPAPAGRKRLVLYGAAGLAVAVVGLMILLGREPAEKPKPAVQQAEETRRQLEQSQTERLIAINLAKARQALIAQKAPEATVYLRQVLAAAPDHAEAKKLLAEAEAAISREETERQKAEAERRAREERITKPLGQAQAALAARDFPRALELARQVLAVDPNEPLARHVAFAAQAGRELAEQEIKAAEAERARRLAEIEALASQARERTAAGDWLKAIGLWEKVLALDPQAQTSPAKAAGPEMARAKAALKAKSAPLAARGEGHLKAGRISEAVEAFHKALTVDPWQERARAGLEEAGQKAGELAAKLDQEARVLDSLGEKRQACDKWRQALKLTGPQDQRREYFQDRVARCGG